MSKEHVFRIQLRLSRAEYEDVVRDLERHNVEDRSARAKLLLRTGLAALSGSPPTIDSTTTTPRQTAMPRRTDQASAEVTARLPGADMFDALGLDPADFKFGTT